MIWQEDRAMNQECLPAYFVMHAKQAGERTRPIMENDNIPVPVWTVTAVKECLNKLGIDPALEGKKRSGCCRPASDPLL